MATAPMKPPPPLANSKPQATAPKISRVPVVDVQPRIVLNAVEGFGKTSCGAYAEQPVIVMTGGETGYETLLKSDRVPDVDRVNVTTWPELLAVCREVNHKTFVLDALSGVERMCHEFVCERDFRGEWADGFMAYGRGPDAAVTEWLKLLVALDGVRARGTTILLLSHSKIKPYKNPLGADYDRFIADLHEKTWSATHRWADAVLFGTFVNVTQKTGNSVKGIGRDTRVIYTQRRDAFDAKNRYGMPESIDIPNDPSKIWSTVKAHF
jgi:hypothetical protein